ncbi:MAG: CoA pyrophosphatase [Armatimonadota bacterium]|nr:CoA pyrophosphatase [Armatimonadota bacterium]
MEARSSAVRIEQIRQRLAARRPRQIEDPAHRLAGVLVPLYESNGQIFVLLTKRTDRVATHKGQISFPGGAVEPIDRDALDAALRETWEEVGIASDDVELLGQLDDVPTVVSGFVIRPFVGRVPHPYELRIAPEEIGEVVRVPLAFFIKDRNLRLEWRERGVERHPVYFYDFGPHVIWGATARIVRDLVELVR